MGQSLNEIRNPLGQLVVSTKHSEVPIKGVQADSPMVENLDAHKVGGHDIQRIKDLINQGDATVLRQAGTVKSLNGVTPDANRNISIVGDGDIEIVPDPAGNAILVRNKNTFYGIGLIGSLQSPTDPKIFQLDVLNDDVTQGDLMVFMGAPDIYGARLLAEVEDYTFDPLTKLMTLTFDPGTRVPRIYARDVKDSNAGIKRIHPVYGSQDGTNRTFVFANPAVTYDNMMIFKNGILQLPLECFTINETFNSITFEQDVLPDAFMEYLQLQDYASILIPVVLTGDVDGVNKIFTYTDSEFLPGNAAIFKNGQKLSYDQADFVFHVDTHEVEFASAPLADSVITAFRKTGRGTLRTINGVPADENQNFTIEPGDGIIVTVIEEAHKIKITIDDAYLTNEAQQVWTWHEMSFVVPSANTLDYTLDHELSKIASKSLTAYIGGGFVHPDNYVVADVTVPGVGVKANWHFNHSNMLVPGDLIYIKYQYK